VKKAHKISFQEAWDSSVVFFVDEELEQEIEANVESLLETAQEPPGIGNGGDQRG